MWSATVRPHVSPPGTLNNLGASTIIQCRSWQGFKYQDNTTMHLYAGAGGPEPAPPYPNCPTELYPIYRRTDEDKWGNAYLCETTIEHASGEWWRCIAPLCATQETTQVCGERVR